MSTKDPKGYYAILELSLTASAAEIKAAYRRRSMELHPDRNKSPNATREFQFLSEAYAVLSEPAARAQYDTSTVETTNRESRASQTPPEPIVCSACGKATAQPRYVIFYEVKSFIVVTMRSPIQGIFCSACAEKKALRATAVTWALGWWGVPWGFFYSLHAIFINLLGGERPRNVNAKLAAHQAWVFAALGRFDVARAIALDALDLARKIKPEQISARIRNALGKDVDFEGSRLCKDLDAFLSALNAATGKSSNVRLKNSWSLFRRPFFAQGLIGLTVIGLVWGAILNDKPSSRIEPMPPRGPKPYIANPAPTSARTPAYIRPTTAPNGEPWPSSAGYVKGYKKLHMNGCSKVTVNSRNDSSVFAKLVSLDGASAYPVRIFFIPASGQMELNSIRTGSYDIRYRDLDSGRLSRSEPFKLEEIRKDEGIQCSDFTLTLDSVINGNMETHALSEDAF